MGGVSKFGSENDGWMDGWITFSSSSARLFIAVAKDPETSARRIVLSSIHSCAKLIIYIGVTRTVLSTSETKKIGPAEQKRKYTREKPSPTLYSSAIPIE